MSLKKKGDRRAADKKLWDKGKLMIPQYLIQGYAGRT